ncbi:MAG: FHA domain-containing protein [Desulfobacterales bacterium]|jgi:pSer/pThr/pTyr-binding forkhead associated (FHA) protein
MPKITLKFKNNVLADYHLPPGCSLKIGRRKDNDIVIDNLAVSSHHGKIDSAGDGFVYIDLKSKNGSFINQQLVGSHWLQDGDVVYIGKHSLTFAYFDSEVRPEDKEQSEMEKTMVMDTSEYRSMMNPNAPQPKTAARPELKPAENSKKKPVRGYITYLVGGEGTLALKQKVTKIGKDASSDIVIKGWNIGKTAATISRTRDGYYFSYVDGLAKPKINDQKTSNKPIKLNELDIIQIGPVKLQFIGKKPKMEKAS